MRKVIWCMLDPLNTHIGKKEKKRSKNYKLTADTSFDTVCAAIQEHTWTNKKDDNWLVPIYVQSRNVFVVRIVLFWYIFIIY